MNLSLSEPPKALIDIITAKHKPKKQVNLIHQHNRFSDDDVRQMLFNLNPDMNYDDWMKVGMALHAGYEDVLHADGSIPAEETEEGVIELFSSLYSQPQKACHVPFI